ncbi:MAG: amidase domain-containing protein [Acidimicrobiales bacterium]
MIKQVRIAGVGVIAATAAIQFGSMTGASASYNGAAAARYANTYWGTYNTADYATFNPDCTNFVSQSLSAGGLPYVGEPTVPVGSDSNNAHWWYFNWGTTSINFESYSWGDAADLKTYLGQPGGVGSSVGVYYDYQAPATPKGWYEGDVAFYSWNGNGQIDHSAIKDGFGWGDPLFDGSLIAQHIQNLVYTPYTYYGAGITDYNPYTTEIYLWHINGNSAS